MNHYFGRIRQFYDLKEKNKGGQLFEVSNEVVYFEAEIGHLIGYSINWPTDLCLMGSMLSFGCPFVCHFWCHFISSLLMPFTIIYVETTPTRGE